MSKIDRIDYAIVDLLMQNGRMPAVEIARRIGNGVSERAVRYRIERLLQDGLIRISAIPDPHALGYSVIADVFIEVEAGRISEVAHQLTEYECISYVACSIGETDVSAQVIARDTTEVYHFITDVIGKLPGVRKTTTLIVPIILRDVYSWRIPPKLCTDNGS